MERYRSGHNEAVLKTVCPKGRVGSNPTLSALGKLKSFLFLCGFLCADGGGEVQGLEVFHTDPLKLRIL